MAAGLREKQILPLPGGRGEDFESDSSMVSSQGRFIRWLCRTFFGAVRFDEDCVKTIRDACDTGTPVYVMDVHSRLDYLYFNYAFVRFGLPLVYFANEITMRAFRPVGNLVRRLWGRLNGRGFPSLPDGEMMRIGLTAGRPCLIFLKRPHALNQWGAEYRISCLQELVRIQSELDKNLMVIPLLLVWDQKPESYRRNILDMLLGDPQAPGALRKSLSFLRNFRKAHAQVGRPINIRALMDEEPESAPESVAVRLKFRIAESLMRETRAIRGPVLKDSGVMVNEIMRIRPFTDSVAHAGASMGFGRAAAEKKASRWLKRIAANFSLGWLEVFSVVLGVIIQRRFTGISVDTAGLARIREIGRDAPIVLVPSRRSIFDYFIYSLVFYSHGLIPPHVAVREQRRLNLFKPFLRRTGAFFVRQYISENRMYEKTLRGYVRKLVKEGYWLEFFLEGSRSRSGKLQPPKSEILFMIVDAVAAGAAPDAWLVPCSVTYEKVVEGSSFERERKGSRKGEFVVSLASIMKRARDLGSRQGRIYMQFCEPVSLKSWLIGQGLTLPLDDDSGNGQLVDPVMVRRLGYSLMSDINRVMVVTPQNLVAFVVMTYRGRGIPRPLLVEQVVSLFRRIESMGGLFSERLKTAVPPAQGPGTTGGWQAVYLDWRETGEFDIPGYQSERPQRVTAIDGLIEEVLGVFVKEGALAMSGEGFDSVISIVEKKRAWLEYYKNAIIHFFLPEAIVSTVMFSKAGTDRVSEVELHSGALELLKVFRYEFIYDKWVSMVETRSNTVEAMLESGMLTRTPHGLSVNREHLDDLEWYVEILRPFVDSYRVLASVVVKATSRMDRDDIISQAMKVGRKAWEIGEVDKMESVSPVLFKNAYRLLQEEVAAGRQPDMKTAAEKTFDILPVIR